MDTGPTGLQEQAPMSATPAGGVTLDTLLPAYDTRMIDTVIIAQPRAIVWETLDQLKTSDMPMAQILGTIRAIPLAARQLIGRPAGEAAPQAPTEQTFKEQMLAGDSWVLLNQEPEREFTIGLVGKFWQMDFGFQPMRDREQFTAFNEPDYAKIVTTYRLEDIPGGTRLLTETRVHATDDEAARKFNRYWRLIQLGATLTVRSLLNAVKRRAEAPTAEQPAPSAAQRPGQTAGFSALLGSAGLFVRALYLTISGAPARLRLIPRLLLYLEVLISGLTTALAFWAWVWAPLAARQRRQALALQGEEAPTALTQPAERYATRFGAQLGIGMWAFTLVVHTIRVLIYISPGHGLKSDH